MMETSAIYECKVSHHRLKPKQHRFSYQVFYLWLDLDEIPKLNNRLKFLSRNRWNLFGFYDQDHLDNGAGDTKRCILKYLEDNEVDTSEVASIRLLTFPRVFGYIFNPVCFYYTFDKSGKPLHALAEVTNTFHEQKPFVLREHDAEGRFRLMTPKHFYVSPFSPLDLCFDFKLKVPDEGLEIHIDDRDQGDRVLLTTLTGKRRPLTDGALLACAVKYPLLTLRVIFLIHWHALRLWMKKLPLHRKADHPEHQQGVLRPHHSLTSSKS
ncbi:DUF1365 domain-containing protein [Phragmitibacter flavus]|uniref:DUF1365 domain-containing protein n=1 Tax=Phragmitibacter flavus TaxID=2576071 RepID=A0A5R8K7H5_9BACT|nr:DUF1365 domain-containing protein [Phragmitibacter flavus]TLD68307.1 DUF1365 domain-containing protein [Phragmitibacter flavus]